MDTSIVISDEKIIYYFSNRDIISWIHKWIDIEGRILEKDDGIPIDKVKEYLTEQADFTRAIVKESVEELHKKTLHGHADANSQFAELKQKLIDNTVLMERILGTSQKRGAIIEDSIFNLLVKSMPNEEIEYVAKQARSGDIMIHGNPVILVDTKNYNKNVPTAEVEKFKRDCKVQNCCGILVSISTGICKKEDFSVELSEGSILVYISNNGPSVDKILLAIQVIRDLFKVEFSNKDSVVLDSETVKKVRKSVKDVEESRRETIEHLEKALASAKKIKLSVPI